ncbi:MerR family DNA-binding transcriptional regulator [Pseudomonas aeruginosa]|nr:MerR family DNA-binding transcriptional regulator [Pseudomonas aeruginosa]
MKIGELAEITGTAVETIRFYKREKLLPSAARDGVQNTRGGGH